MFLKEKIRNDLCLFPCQQMKILHWKWRKAWAIVTTYFRQWGECGPQKSQYSVAGLWGSEESWGAWIGQCIPWESALLWDRAFGREQSYSCHRELRSAKLKELFWFPKGYVQSSHVQWLSGSSGWLYSQLGWAWPLVEMTFPKLTCVRTVFALKYQEMDRNSDGTLQNVWPDGCWHHYCFSAGD